MGDIIDLIYEDHDWLRRHFFYLDGARTEEELAAVWEPLADRLDLHAEAEEAVFYPVLLVRGGAADAGDPKDETEDAISDHNEIRDAVSAARRHAVGTPEWYEAVGKARTENGKHLDEEEREALPDFRKSSSADLRHELAMKWLQFYYQHSRPPAVQPTDKDPDEYIDEYTSESAADDR